MMPHSVLLACLIGRQARNIQTGFCCPAGPATQCAYALPGHGPTSRHTCKWHTTQAHRDKDPARFPQQVYHVTSAGTQPHQQAQQSCAGQSVSLEPAASLPCDQHWHASRAASLGGSHFGQRLWVQLGPLQHQLLAQILLHVGAHRLNLLRRQRALHPPLQADVTAGVALQAPCPVTCPHVMQVVALQIKAAHYAQAHI